jgi:hypothetical protein
MTFVFLANEPGRHGFDIVGPFDTPQDAEAFRAKHKLSGSIEPKPLIAPEDWQPNDGSGDDEA